MRIVTSTCLLLFLVLPRSGGAAWVPVLPGAIERLAASSSHVAAIRNGEVWILRDDGSVTARLGRRDRSSSATNAQTHARRAEEILDVLGVSEFDRDSDWSIDLLNDERTLRERQSAGPAPVANEESSAIIPAVVGSRAGLWVVLGRSWFRVDRTGNVIREVWGSQAGRTLAATSQQLLVGGPEGLTLHSLDSAAERRLPLLSPPDRVALSASGRRWAWSDAGGTWWSDGVRSENLGATPAAVDLVYCGETLVVLLPEGLLAIAPDTAPQVRAPDLRAHRLRCPDGEASPWLALGSRLSVSLDGGRQWAPLDTPPADELVDVAASSHHVWLATRSGLYVSADRPAAGGALVPTAASPSRRRRRRPNAWLSWLPKVSLHASATSGSSERQLEALALAQFALDRSALPAVAVAAGSEPLPAESPRPSRPDDLRDPDRECLGRVRRKAIEFAMTEPSRAQSYVVRAGRAAWLPELRVLVSRRYGRSESLDLAGSSTALSSPLGIDTVNDIRYEARATWDLARLVFSAEELAAQNQALHMAELRRDLETTVNRLYFERRRLTLEGGGNGWAHPLRASEIEAELDALSGGAFGACLAEKPHPQSAP